MVRNPLTGGQLRTASILYTIAGCRTPLISLNWRGTEDRQLVEIAPHGGLQLGRETSNARAELLQYSGVKPRVGGIGLPQQVKVGGRGHVRVADEHAAGVEPGRARP